ncbi:YitT family protein [Clostridium felsineum]|uniref:YitT family protein n=1 Tax=Clostridium felsineum TaxID=36839 RepID=UPI00098CB74A|nr:YitT family protein [Clostridium felsineum]URZ17953.1 hypothetical protein CLFE_040080 [Clostridium felsineum DSM 794]
MKKFKEYFYITLGFLIVAASVRFFFEPNNIAGGGVTGFAIVINKFFGSLSVGLITFVLNAILFAVAMIFIDGNFGIKTLYSSFGLSISLWIMDKYIVCEPITKNLLLATLFGTLISGVGMGICFNQNASTGGTDILAKMMNKFLHMDIGKSLLLVDFVITLFAGFALGADIGMYSLLSVIISGFVIDSVIEGLNICKKVMIISDKNKVISDFIIKELERGCTIVDGKGGYTGKDTYILYTVLNRKEFIKLRIFIKETDPNAFITISDAKEVLGEGFKEI